MKGAILLMDEFKVGDVVKIYGLDKKYVIWRIHSRENDSSTCYDRTYLLIPFDTS